MYSGPLDIYPWFRGSEMTESSNQTESCLCLVWQLKKKWWSCFVVSAWYQLEEVPLYMSKGLTAKCCRCWVLVQRGTLEPTGRHPSTTKPALPSSTFWHQRWAPSHGSCSPASPRTYCCYCFAWAWHYSVLYMLTLTYRLFTVFMSV